MRRTRRVVGVAEIREARRALAQGELERRHREQLRAHPEDLQEIARRGVDRHDAIAEAVGEERGFGLLAVADRVSLVEILWSAVRCATAGPRPCRHAKSPATRTAMRQFTRSDKKLAAVCAFTTVSAGFAFL